MNFQDEQIIRTWAGQRPQPATLLLAREEGAVGRLLAQFCDRLKALMPALRVKTAADETFRAPALIIGPHRNIAYQAIPEGSELPPFLAALAGVAEGGAELPPEFADWSARMELPAELTLYITMQCPHCPKAVGQLLALAAATPKIRMAVVDGRLFDAQAAGHGIRSVPTLLLEDQLRWSGTIDVVEVIRQCLQRDPSRLSAASLRQILEAGDAPRAAAMMIARGAIFPALLPLLTHERWSVRLGAMVAVEYLADEAPALVTQLVDPLWEKFGSLPESVQGDVVQVLGQVQGDAATRCLHTIAAGHYAADVKEAAVEELENR